HPETFPVQASSGSENKQALIINLTYHSAQNTEVYEPSPIRCLIFEFSRRRLRLVVAMKCWIRVVVLPSKNNKV
ncbi:MAG: hypothetical protein ACRD72_22830, partial [Candidatus Angelobacter sp.]